MEIIEPDCSEYSIGAISVPLEYEYEAEEGIGEIVLPLLIKPPTRCGRLETTHSVGDIPIMLEESFSYNITLELNSISFLNEPAPTGDAFIEVLTTGQIFNYKEEITNERTFSFFLKFTPPEPEVAFVPPQIDSPAWVPPTLEQKTPMKDVPIPTAEITKIGINGSVDIEFSPQALFIFPGWNQTLNCEFEDCYNKCHEDNSKNTTYVSGALYVEVTP